jgi:hypothetical protein
MHFLIQHNEISKTHLFWFLPQKKKVFFLQASVIFAFFGFSCIYNEMRGSRSKIPSKKISSGSAKRRDLIPAIKD